MAGPAEQEGGGGDGRPPRLAAIVAARNEVETIAETLEALRAAMPEVSLWVADDASGDGTGEVALLGGARLIRRGRSHGKGGNVTAAAEALLSEPDPPAFVLLCDADLGPSAARLVRLVDAVQEGECDLAVAAFSKRVGGGFGIALRVAGWVIERRCGLRPAAPISGQRAMSAGLLADLLPFAHGYGMECGMTIDAVRAGNRLAEYELDLAHRASGRTPAGFAHRFRQLLDFLRVYASRRAERNG